MAFPVFTTERLELVEITEKHCNRYFEIMSLDIVTRYYGMESLESLEQASAIIDSFRTGYENKRAVRWGIVLKETGAFIGTIGLNNLQIRNKKAELGFEIHPDYWKNGYTTEAARAVIHYVFEELELYRLGAVTFLENEASSGLLKKLDFKEEGILRGYIHQQGENHNTYMFSLLESEWKVSDTKMVSVSDSN